jgi:hypothetical protein
MGDRVGAAPPSISTKPVVRETPKGASLTLPDRVEVRKGRLASIKIDWDGVDIKWITPPQLDVFREYHPDPKIVRLRMIGYEDGSYRMSVLVSSADGKMSDPQHCTIVVGKPSPGPGPGPNPPDPNPPPDPDNPPPIPEAGLRVLIVYETGDGVGTPKVSRTQANQILFSQSMRDWLDSVCVLGKDGKRKEWRMFDQNINMDGADPIWQKAMKRPRDSVPWLLISNGKTGWEGPLPKDGTEFKTLIQRYIE